ncbi:MAG TPA: DUF2242 domain-containing protein [Burkholderiales bacterium]|jgi:hypothetical protein
MHHAIRRNRLFRLGQVPLLAIVLAVSSTCALAKKPERSSNEFSSKTPFSKTLQGSGDTVCWDVKRAFFEQGYMLDRSSDSAVMTGTKDAQKDEKTSVTIRLQATCVDNKNGTSTVFASAAREVSKLQKVRQGVSAGVGIATFSVPTGSENVLQVISRETIADPNFYDGFYRLVQGYVAEDDATAGTHPAHGDLRDSHNGPRVDRADPRDSGGEARDDRDDRTSRIDTRDTPDARDAHDDHYVPDDRYVRDPQQESR